MNNYFFARLSFAGIVVAGIVICVVGGFIMQKLWQSPWPMGFVEVNVANPADSIQQPAYFFSTRDQHLQPLVVSLPTWSKNYQSKDPLAPQIKALNWNYIRPSYRSPTWADSPCLTEKAIANIDMAITFAIQHGKVDPKNIFVVGMSGGGYATLGVYLKTNIPIKAFLAWAPISSLAAWYGEVMDKYPQYANDILSCTGDVGQLNRESALAMSPLHWQPKAPHAGILEMYVGIHDGHKGSVSITHALNFFNKMATYLGYEDSIISSQTYASLRDRTMDPQAGYGTIDERQIFYKKAVGDLSITVFDGTHELLTEYCVKRLQELTLI